MDKTFSVVINKNTGGSNDSCRISKKKCFLKRMNLFATIIKMEE